MYTNGERATRKLFFAAQFFGWGSPTDTKIDKATSYNEASTFRVHSRASSKSCAPPPNGYITLVIYSIGPSLTFHGLHNCTLSHSAHAFSGQVVVMMAVVMVVLIGAEKSNPYSLVGILLFAACVARQDSVI